MAQTNLRLHVAAKDDKAERRALAAKVAIRTASPSAHDPRDPVLDSLLRIRSSYDAVEVPVRPHHGMRRR